MKKCLLFLGIFLFSSSLIKSQVIDKMMECPIEGIEWGMSKREVLKEKVGAKKTGAFVWNNDENNFGYSGKVIYAFNSKDQLKSIMFYYDDDTYDSDEIYENYIDVEEEFTDELGEGDVNYNWVNKNSTFDQEDEFGTALAIGDLKLSSFRDFKNGYIDHSLAKQDDHYKLDHIIYYVNTEYNK